MLIGAPKFCNCDCAGCSEVLAPTVRTRSQMRRSQPVLHGHRVVHPTSHVWTSRNLCLGVLRQTSPPRQCMLHSAAPLTLPTPWHSRLMHTVRLYSDIAPVDYIQWIQYYLGESRLITGMKLQGADPNCTEPVLGSCERLGMRRVTLWFSTAGRSWSKLSLKDLGPP